MTQDIKNAILSCDDLPVESVSIPEWGVEGLSVISMNGIERDKYEGGILASRELPLEERLSNARTMLVILCLVDENKDHIFTLDDVDKVGKKSAEILNRIATAASALNKLDVKSVEEVTKN